MSNQMKRYTGRSPEGPKHRSFCPCGISDKPPSQHLMGSCSPTKKLYKPL